MTNKKAILVIVEGPSDDSALGAIFENFFDKSNIFVKIMHGDITSERGVYTNNIVKKVSEEVKSYAINNSLRRSDFLKIIHIVDMDGAYIPDKNILQDNTLKKAQYSLKNICVKDKKQLQNRNNQKSENLNKLCKVNKVWTSIPYCVYYMSCNLDHVLYNKLNSSDDEKENDAYNFAIKYKKDIPSFLKFIKSSGLSVTGNYKDSWEFIKKDLNSLNRFTNLGLCFK